MRTQGLLTGAARFAGHLIRNPIKTTLNTIEGIKAGPDFPDNKIVTGVAGAAGLGMVFLGAVNRDLLLAGMGATFAVAAGGIYEHNGGRIRAEIHAARVAEEGAAAKEGPIAAEKPEVKSGEIVPDAESSATTHPVLPAAKPSFKPNLPRPTGLGGGP